ncbi:MAG: sigma-54 interaction domain-containing protein, partial [Desulfatiglandales bacterium]
VLIKGESGTGKELVARAIHTRGPRAKSSFITINCPAVPKDLLESELFGYEKGAFTGATESKPGRFELANKGTIFLDEIGDLDISLQSKLLRVLEYGEFERVGGVKSVKVDVRVIAATNKDLKEEIKKGKFREDLFFRINVFPIYIPPLRERKEDILPLAEHFVRLFAEELKKEVPSISDEMKAFLLSQDWKGNVRELKNTIERYMILCDKAVITPDMISVQNYNECYSDYTALKDRVKASTGAAEKHKIIEALRLTKGNKLKASKLLKVSYKTLLTKIKNYGIDTE